MNQRQMMRSLRKEMLLLQAEQHRAAIRQDVRSLRPGFSAQEASPVWMDLVRGLLGSGGAGRWSSLLGVGVMLWRFGKGVFSRKRAEGRTKENAA